MQTTLSSGRRTVIIGDDQPTRLIGERINPTGRKKLTAALLAGDLEMVRQEAAAQVAAGADIIDVNVGAAGVDDVALLPRAVAAVMDTVDAPISIDTANPVALRAALTVYRDKSGGKGKALINSMNGEEKSLNAVLPLAAEFGAAVICLTMDDRGIPTDDPGRRVDIARNLIARAEAMGVPRENLLIDCLAMTVGADQRAGAITLEAIRRVRDELGMNMTLGASNVSFGLPERETINRAFLPLVLMAGVNCPIVNVAKVRDVILATDLLLGKDEFAMNYIQYCRSHPAGA